MIRQVRTLLDRGWIMGVAAVVLVVAAVGATSVVASAADPLAPLAGANPAMRTQLHEAIPAFETPYGLQSWPHNSCVDSRGGCPGSRGS